MLLNEPPLIHWTISVYHLVCIVCMYVYRVSFEISNHSWFLHGKNISQLCDLILND